MKSVEQKIFIDEMDANPEVFLLEVAQRYGLKRYHPIIDGGGTTNMLTNDKVYRLIVNDQTVAQVSIRVLKETEAIYVVLKDVITRIKEESKSKKQA